MARIYEPTKEQAGAWKEWVSARPDVVRAVAERLDPWSLYRMKSTGNRVGNRVTLYSISEDGTVTVDVTAEYNFLSFERRVFGVLPDDLEPCDVPAPTELVGALLTNQDVEENLDVLRVLMRPDLWELDDDLCK